MVAEAQVMVDLRLSVGIVRRQDIKQILSTSKAGEYWNL